MSIFPAKILVGTDGSEEATLAAETAVALATRTGSKLHVLAAGPEYPYYELPDAPARFEEVLQEQKRATREVLDDQVARIEASGATVEEAHLTMGERPDRAIVDLAEKLGAGLIVVGSRGLGGLRRIAVGSVSDSVVRHAHCPVLVVRHDGQGFPPGRILLALDGSEQADSAARMAVELADRTGSELHVIHVGEVAPLYHPERHGYHALYENLREHAKEVLEEQLEKIKAAGGSVSGSHLGIGRPDREIVAHAEELGSGLIVVGSRGLGGIRRALMGSVSTSVVRHAHGSVLVVRKGG